MVMMMVSNFLARAVGTSHFLPRDQISHLQPRIDANHALRLITSRFLNDKFINLSQNIYTAHYFRDSRKLRHHSRRKLIFYNHKEDGWALFRWSMIIDHLSMINDEDYAKSDAGLCRPWLRSVTSLFLLIISSSFFLIIYWSSSLSSFWSSLIVSSSAFLIFYWSAPLLPKYKSGSTCWLQFFLHPFYIQ